MNFITKTLNKLDEFISILAIIGIVGIVSINIFSRFFFNTSIAWTEEVSLGLFVWLVFAGFSVVMKNNEHVSIDYFVRKLPGKWYRINQYLVIAIVFFSVLIVFVLWGLILSIQSTWNITPVLGIGYEWIYLSVPVGGLLSLYHIIMLFVNKRSDIILKEEEAE